MGRFLLWLVIPILAILGYGFYVFQTTGSFFGIEHTIFFTGAINISTQGFMDGGIIPSDYTCNGENLSPPFILQRVPTDAKSLAIVLEDSNSSPKNFTHWLAFNLNPYTTTIVSSKVLGNVVVGTNDYGNSEYDGPCPPPGETHKYYFKIYALDTVLNLDQNAKRADLDKAMNGHIIATGQILGSYTKQ